MAETVVSMARSLVGSAIGVAASAAVQEMSMLMGVQNEIWYMKDELKTMEAFLRAAEVTREKDGLVKVWAEQVRDLAYDIEDCLQEFALHVGRQSLARQLMKLRHRHRIAVQIRRLKLRVEEVSNRNMRYNLIKSVPSSSMDDSTSNFELTRYQAAHYVDEAELVGFDGPKKEIQDMISSSGSTEAQVILIVGAGGLGKTTLAKRIYESSNISSKFSCRAWISVSQSFDVKELLKVMIKQLLGENSLKELLEQHKGMIVHDHNLTDHLKEGLNGKRYFLVLDDLWRKQDWDCIKPTSWGNNRQGSLVVVTTRNRDIVGGSLVYQLKTLEKEDATKLLLRKTRRSLDDIEKDRIMKETFEKILKKCGGLPLAIVTIGGLLAEKDVKDWETLWAQLPSELEINPSLEAMRKVVSLSYNYLPSHLKPCFLYLSIFPEDFEIKRNRLVNRWIAEGFVRARDGVSIVDIANTYFDELIGRSMIQPSKVNIEGTIIKSCRVHDIMRDIMTSISREENFVHLISDNGTTVVEENIRHVAYHDSKCPKIVMHWNHVRSLTVFGQRPKELAHSLCSPHLRLLRVLDLQDVNFGMSQKDMNTIGLLLHLKYIYIRYGQGYSNIYALPRSIGKLQGLQTLEIFDTYIKTLPTEICKLQSLRILRCRRSSSDGRFAMDYYRFDPDEPMKCLLNLSCMPVMMAFADSDERGEMIAELHMGCSSRWSTTPGVRVPRGISNLKELQVLEVVDIKRTSSKAVKELGELSQLRKLIVVTEGATEQKCKILCASIQKLSSLRYLYVDAAGSSSTGTPEWLDSISSPPPFLRSLELVGCIKEMPDWFRELSHLVKICLWRSQLKEGKTVEILGGLPNLMILRFYLSAYAGEKLEFRAGAFPNLRKLFIYSEEQLREMRFEEGTSPRMETIEIDKCRLESGMIGIKHLPRLKEISLLYDGRVARLDQLQEEVDEHPNRPVLRMLESRSRHNLGDIGGSTVQVEATEESFPEPAGESSGVIMLTENDSSLSLAKPSSSEVAHLSPPPSRDQAGSPSGSERETLACSTSPRLRIEELDLDILKTSTDDVTSPVGVQIAEDLLAGSQSAN